MTGRPAEDFETIARRYVALPRNQRTLGNGLRQFAQFMMALDRYDRELPPIPVAAAVRTGVQGLAA